MNKLFGLVLLALAFLAPTSANASCSGGACFWIGGTGTLNLTSDSAHWATTSGGTTCSCEPGSGDTINFDASSGSGTITVNTGGTWTNGGWTLGACACTVDFATNNNSITQPFVQITGGGAGKTLNMGNGTWTVTRTNNNAWFVSGSVTLNKNSSTISITATISGSLRTFQGGGQSYNIVNISNGNALFPTAILGANSFGTLTLGNPGAYQFGNSVTQTITTFTNITGTSSSGGQVSISVDSTANGSATISSANNWTCTYCSIQGMAFTGGGTFTGTNSFDASQNTGVTITAPSAGGGGGGRIIGG